VYETMGMDSLEAYVSDLEVVLLASTKVRGLCMYVCMCVCVYVCMYVCVYVCMCVCVYLCMCVRMCVCMYVCMYICVYVCIYVPRGIRVRPRSGVARIHQGTFKTYKTHTIMCLFNIFTYTKCVFYTKVRTPVYITYYSTVLS
jgi:hypothetical protein